MKMCISIWLPLEQFSFSTVTMATITMVTVVFLFSNTAVTPDSRILMLGWGGEMVVTTIYVFGQMIITGIQTFKTFFMFTLNQKAKHFTYRSTI